MSARPDLVETGARGVVAAVRWGRRRRNCLSVLGLLTILVVGVAYLLLDTLQRDPTASNIRVEVELAQSGGLLPNQDVTLRGVPVGRVDSVRIDDEGVRVVATIDAGIRIPADGEVRVSSLSPAGEQFLDFRPAGDSAPFLRVPALREFFFPTQRSGSTLDAIGTAFRDGGLWGSVDVYPRVPCDYDLPRAAASRPDFPEPFINTHCKNTELLVRGAGAVPRPPGDDTNLPAPGSDPQARTDPTPRGPKTIPTPFGGPDIHYN
ncbi:MlaD family protein [Gordonia amicalis]|uniref:MlaD family protein n=1 Tax=Gordonia amicalis TaxID=89053 RepID=UPI0003465D39|nr:MlaD family protein [Gordonia amicalis]MBA5845733.1 MCE family protein [Gordonia amicalis]MCZ0914828.1 MlaD family protein [Gordonia amicalis]MDV7099322.1 MlaD family protein [Gordonia amicalis]MDV7174815.1 MlaD family protein [Gordonia amicalis]NKX78394.1 MCE family protein [Gordonia amicalis]